MPTIVSRDGKLVLVTGSPGSRTIINTVLEVVLGVTAWDLPGQEAVNAPRFDHEWLPDHVVFEAGGFSQETLDALTAMGHTVVSRGRQGSAQSVWIHPQTGTAFGVADHRDPTAGASKPGGGQ